MHQESSLKSAWKKENGNSYPWEDGNGNGGNGTGHSNTGNGGSVNGGGHNHSGNNSDGLKHANCKQCVDTQEAFVQSMADDAVSIDGTDYLPVGKPNSYKDYELIYYINDVTIENEEVLVEYGAAGTATGTYEYGLQRLSVEYVNEAKEYYLYNGTGNVTQTTAENGSAFLRYTYDPFGNVTSIRAPLTVDIDDLNRYTYNGEDYDYNTGLQYLRARYYSTSTGSFISQDTYLGRTISPLSQNRYTYAHNNPVMYDDPSGHITVNATENDTGCSTHTEISENIELEQAISDVFKSLYHTTIPDSEVHKLYSDYIFRQAANGDTELETMCREIFNNVSKYIEICSTASRNGWSINDTYAAIIHGDPLSLEEMFWDINNQAQGCVTVNITDNTIEVTVYADFHGEEDLIISGSNKTYKELVIEGFTSWSGIYSDNNDIFGFDAEVKVDVVESRSGMDVYLFDDAGISNVALHGLWQTTSEKDMRLYTQTVNGELRTPEFVMATAAHELGHVLGIGDAYLDGSKNRPAADSLDAPSRSIMKNHHKGIHIYDNEVQMFLYAFSENAYQHFITYDGNTRSEALDK